MKTPPPSTLLSAAPRQLAIPFESVRLRGMTAAERRISLTRLGQPCCCRPPRHRYSPGSVTMTSADLLPGRGAAAQGGRLHSPVDPATGPDQSRKPAAAIRAGRCRLRQRGFRDVEVIDDVSRPFRQRYGGPTGVSNRLVAWLCAGEVSAVLLLWTRPGLAPQRSRLASPARCFCGLVEARAH